MLNVLEDDYGCIGINIKTIWLWRLKLIHAMAANPMPVLTGIIQVDETFIRESQKGSRNLISYLDKHDVRRPRYGRRPSKYGVMGPEFATVTTAIDQTGLCVCKVSGLGILTKNIFVDLFEDHLRNPSYICSDANSVYEEYCKLFNIAHYIKPSNYLSVLKKAGYETPSFGNPTQYKITSTKNKKILEGLFYEESIDKITNRGSLYYEEFEYLKTQNRLNLGRVNELHDDIKSFIYRDMTNVSTKYLQDYIGYFTYKRNWKVTNGHYPSSRKDAEKIFTEILKSKVGFTINDVKSKKLDLPKPSSRYIILLKSETERVRDVTPNPYFKFDEEDGFATFRKRDYLMDQSKNKLYSICKECKLTKYKKLALWSMVSQLLRQPNIDEIIYKLLVEDRHYKMAEEDLDSMKAGRFSK